MPRIVKMRKSITALALAVTCVSAAAQPSVDAHLAAAKKAEGTDFPGTIARLCIVPDAPVGGGGGVRAIPDRASWYAEPARMFDNLYWVGTKIHSAWALQTSGGIILIDTLYNYAVEPEIVEGSRNWGWIPPPSSMSSSPTRTAIMTKARGCCRTAMARMW
jgi:hypothetical protein